MYSFLEAFEELNACSLQYIAEGYYADRAAHIFGGAPEDYQDDTEALDEIIKYYQDNNSDFEKFLAAVDPDYRAKSAVWNGNTLDYYINGFGDDFDFVAEMFKKYYATKPGKYTLVISARQSDKKEKQYNILIK